MTLLKLTFSYDQDRLRDHWMIIIPIQNLPTWSKLTEMLPFANFTKEFGIIGVRLICWCLKSYLYSSWEQYIGAQIQKYVDFSYRFLWFYLKSQKKSG